MIDEAGGVCGPGQTGKLARGGHVPLGYYKDPVKTAEMFTEVNGKRYAVPGDWARVEEDGSITLLGRGNTCVNTGGEKVYPEEVEGALKSHPDVFDSLVIGVPDDRLGQRVAALVQLASRRRRRPGRARRRTCTASSPATRCRAPSGSWTRSAAPCQARPTTAGRAATSRNIPRHPGASREGPSA